MKGVAVISGGAGQLGRAIANRLGTDGFTVALLDRDESALASVAEVLSSASIRCISKRVDVTNSLAVKRVADQLHQDAGPAMILVTAAGWSPKRGGVRPATLDISHEEWNVVLDINLTAVFNCITAFLPQMISAGSGRIVTIASTAGITGSATAGVHYCASKAGVLGLTRALATELAPLGIIINAIAPGKMVNPQWEDTEAAREAYIRSIPLGRLATTAEVSEAVAFLASGRNTYMTGITLVVDGGRLAW